MTMTTRRMVATTGAAAGLALLLAGCGDGDKKTGGGGLPIGTGGSGTGTGGASGSGPSGNGGAVGNGGSQGNPFSGGTSGSGNGGAPGTGGAAARGGASGGDGPVLSGPAVGKFCNTLVNADGTFFEQTLEVGNPPVKLTALSGKCSTDVGKACITLPTGRVVLAIVEGGQTVATAAYTIEPGQKYLFLTTVNAMNMEGLTGGPLRPEFTCESVNPFENAGADGGAPPPPLPPGRPFPAPDTLIPMTRFHAPQAPHRHMGLERNAAR